MRKSASAILLLLAMAACTQVKEIKSEDSAADEPTGESNDKAAESRPVILFYGNSITAGYNLDMSEAFPALLQQRLDSLGYSYLVVNAGLSGETSAGGLSRIEWVLKTPVDIFMLELGGNDGLRGIGLADTRKNLSLILEKVKQSNPGVKLIVAGMQIPPNMGQEYTEEFRTIYPALAEQHGALLIPFLLENVGGIPELNLPDGIHPTPEGHEIVAENVWSVLKEIVEKDKI